MTMGSTPISITVSGVQMYLPGETGKRRVSCNISGRYCNQVSNEYQTCPFQKQQINCEHKPCTL
jgi:hypothetical protein